MKTYTFSLRIERKEENENNLYTTPCLSVQWVQWHCTETEVLWENSCFGEFTFFSYKATLRNFG